MLSAKVKRQAACLMLLVGLADLAPARWNSADPQSLERLRGGAVNCILLEPQNWNPNLLQAARGRNLATYGVIHPGQDSVKQAHRAAKLKLPAVALDEVAIVELANRGEMRLDAGDPI